MQSCHRLERKALLCPAGRGGQIKSMPLAFQARGILQCKQSQAIFKNDSKLIPIKYTCHAPVRQEQTYAV